MAWIANSKPEFKVKDVESLYFLAIGIALYVVADRLLDLIERNRGSRFEHRSVIFFFILLGLAVTAFALLRRMSGQGEPWIGG